MHAETEEHPTRAAQCARLAQAVAQPVKRDEAVTIQRLGHQLDRHYIAA
jgi:hypothetical protein